MGYVTIGDFERLDIRVGRVVSVERVPRAKSLYRIKVDIGGGVVRQTIAGLVGHYAQEELQGKKVVFLANLKPKRFMGQVSEGMLLAAEAEGKVALLTIDRDLPEGSRVR